MKRFYEQAAVAKKDGGYIILLDGREVKTPEKRTALIPTKAMADVVQGEWQAQVEKIDPFSMPLTKLLNTGLDRVGPRRADLIDELVNYAGSDQLCYRAEFPDPFIKRFMALACFAQEMKPFNERLANILVKRCLSGKKTLNRYPKGKPDNPAHLVILRIRSAASLARRTHGIKDHMLAVQKRAVAIKQNKFQVAHNIRHPAYRSITIVG